MKYRMWTRILFVLLVAPMLGCRGQTSVPTGPSGGTPPTPQAGGLFIAGTVSDSAFRELAGARVEVLDGPQAGLAVTSDSRGQFWMSGAFDETTQFRATAEGHVTATSTLQPFCERCHPNWWIHFTLATSEAPVAIGGDYEMTVAANKTCTTLPEEMRSRTYTATIPATSALPANFSVGGATFLRDWDFVSVGVAGDYVALWFETLVEQIAPNIFLSFGGQAAATVDPSNLSRFVLPFEGSIEYCVAAAEGGQYQDCHQGRATVQRCESSHRLVFTRR